MGHTWRLNECDRKLFSGHGFGDCIKVSGHALSATRNALPLLHESVLSLVDRQFEDRHLLSGDTWGEKVGTWRECMNALSDPLGQVLRQHLGRLFRTLAHRLDYGLDASWVGIILRSRKRNSKILNEIG